MAWTAGSDVSTGDLITAAQWNNYLGATGSLEYLYDKGTLMWCPVTYGTNAIGVEGDVPTILCQNTDQAMTSFTTPTTFNTLLKAVLVVIAKATQAAANWDIYSDYGASGEQDTTHSESDTASTYNVTAEYWYDIDVSGILSSLAGGDHGGIQLLCSTAGHDVEVVGLHMEFS